ncbi:MAG: hypothetical protein KatS3mg117_3302 [Geminicoccaceae bacterium]|jgi:hypothetical protein|nr:MAG: hypothetical protein KatS3mg117_3302 [Geminicoccaceae bacterium]
MPRNPSEAQREAARRNGRRSKGATTAEGRARLAAAATRHNLFGPFRLLPGEDRLAFERLRRAWHARLKPADRAEREAADAFVAQLWRRQRLDLLEVRLLDAILHDRPRDGLPSLETLLRYRARLDRERARIEAELWALRVNREAALDRRPIRVDPPAPAATGARLAEPGSDDEERGVVLPFRPRRH